MQTIQVPFSHISDSLAACVSFDKCEIVGLLLVVLSYHTYGHPDRNIICIVSHHINEGDSERL